jgi:hypothetical protein
VKAAYFTPLTADLAVTFADYPLFLLWGSATG